MNQKAIIKKLAADEEGPTLSGFFKNLGIGTAGAATGRGIMTLIGNITESMRKMPQEVLDALDDVLDVTDGLWERKSGAWNSLTGGQNPAWKARSIPNVEEAAALFKNIPRGNFTNPKHELEVALYNLRKALDSSVKKYGKGIFSDPDKIWKIKKDLDKLTQGSNSKSFELQNLLTDVDIETQKVKESLANKKNLDSTLRTLRKWVHSPDHDDLNNLMDEVKNFSKDLDDTVGDFYNSTVKRPLMDESHAVTNKLKLSNMFKGFWKNQGPGLRAGSRRFPWANPKNAVTLLSAIAAPVIFNQLTGSSDAEEYDYE